MRTNSILIVEDEVVIAQSLQLMLEGMGYEVISRVTSGKEAIQECLLLSPDLVLMDINLSGDMDGISAVTEMQSQGIAPPVIYLTAFADKGTIERAKVTRPVGYLIKPFEQRELSITLEMAFYNLEVSRKLKENETLFSTILKSIGQPVVITDKQGRITFANFLAEQMLGLPSGAYKGHSFDSFFSFKSKKGDKVDLIYESVQTSLVISPEDGEYWLVAGSVGNKVETAELNISPVIDDYGNTIGAVLMFKPL